MLFRFINLCLTYPNMTFELLFLCHKFKFTNNNFRYDGHLLVDELGKRELKKARDDTSKRGMSGVTVIPKNMESYTAIMTSKFRFIG